MKAATTSLEKVSKAVAEQESLLRQGGGYLPVLCDKLLMTEGSGLYLAGPALVKAAIGQVADAEELGGAKMHAAISGTVDFYEPDDSSCLSDGDSTSSDKRPSHS